jgi:hypothetical protein
MLIGRITSDAILDEAYAWLCHRRRDYPANADVWWFRRNWASEKVRLQQDLLTGTMTLNEGHLGKTGVYDCIDRFPSEMTSPLLVSSQ